MIHAAAALLALLLGAVAAHATGAGPVQLLPPAHGERHGEYSCATSPCEVPPHFVLTNASTAGIVGALASHPRRHRGDRAGIFTTLRFADGSDARAASTDDVLSMLSNFCYWLDKTGRLENAMLITTDERCA